MKLAGDNNIPNLKPLTPWICAIIGLVSGMIIAAFT